VAMASTLGGSSPVRKLHLARDEQHRSAGRRGAWAACRPRRNLRRTPGWRARQRGEVSRHGRGCP
jgi:hypothetical protein